MWLGVALAYDSYYWPPGHRLAGELLRGHVIFMLYLIGPTCSGRGNGARVRARKGQTCPAGR